MSKMSFHLGLFILLCIFLLGCKQEETKVPDVSNSTWAYFEYAEEDPPCYKEISSEILVISKMFDTLQLEESSETFSDEEWIYRITFNPSEIGYRDQTVVLVFSDHMDVNDVHYVGKDGIEFSNILEYIKAKYDYFEIYESHYY